MTPPTNLKCWRPPLGPPTPSHSYGRRMSLYDPPPSRKYLMRKTEAPCEAESVSVGRGRAECCASHRDHMSSTASMQQQAWPACQQQAYCNTNTA